MELKATFFDLVAKYDNSVKLVDQFWEEIRMSYSAPGRHYHTLTHLENLLQQLEQTRIKILDWDAVLWSVYYHDIIYKPTKGNNEEKSAELAKSRLQELNVSVVTIDKCNAMILATKNHLRDDDSDINYFTDADLSILGQSWDIYKTYFTQIRKEYSIYPDLIYNPGRKKVIDQFLKMDRIYKTEHFHQNLEANARKNILRERELY